MQYNIYEKHYAECKARNKECENEVCKAMKLRILDLEAKLNKVEKENN